MGKVQSNNNYGYYVTLYYTIFIKYYNTFVNRIPRSESETKVHNQFTFTTGTTNYELGTLVEPFKLRFLLL
jgi:hypothetical protein